MTISGTGFSYSGATFPTTLAANRSLSLTVKFAPQSPASGSVTGSVAIKSNAKNSPATVSLNGNAVQTAHSVTLTWDDSASSVVGYNIYRSTIHNGPYDQLNTVLETSNNYVDDDVAAGVTYYYVVSAVDGTNIESDMSAETSAKVPSP